jgi:hypothetical protein
MATAASVVKKAFNNPVSNTIRGGASLLFGIVLATMASVMLGTGYVTSTFAKNVLAHVTKNIHGGKDIKYDPLLDEFCQACLDGIKEVWEEFGVYGFKETLEMIGEAGDDILNELGYGDASMDPDSVESRTASIGLAAGKKPTEIGEEKTKLLLKKSREMGKEIAREFFKKNEKDKTKDITFEQIVEKAMEKAKNTPGGDPTPPLTAVPATVALGQGPAPQNIPTAG